jgi:hypothetical protein
MVVDTPSAQQCQITAGREIFGQWVGCDFVDEAARVADREIADAGHLAMAAAFKEERFGKPAPLLIFGIPHGAR